MKIGILNLEPHIMNLALEKIAMYWKLRGAEVEPYDALWHDSFDEIYCSSIFTFTDKQNIPANAIRGGSGFDLTTKLPGYIEMMKPKINYGFTTRGCIRKCSFCFVPEKEGNIRVVGDIYDFWDGESKELIIMDNNILAMPEHFKMICGQLRDNKLKVDFNQGLDFRLLTDELCKELFSLRHIHEIRFAFDDVGYERMVKEALDMLGRNGLKRWQSKWYVYIGEKDSFDTVYNRLQILKGYKQLAYVMRDEKVYDRPIWIALAKWANMMGSFKYDFFDLLEKCKEFKSYRKYFDIDKRQPIIA
jgi:hypothetical protein